MAITRTTITGNIVRPDGDSPTNAIIRSTMTGFDTEAGADAVVSVEEIDDLFRAVMETEI